MALELEADSPSFTVSPSRDSEPLSIRMEPPAEMEDTPVAWPKRDSKTRLAPEIVTAPLSVYTPYTKPFERLTTRISPPAKSIWPYEAPAATLPYVPSEFTDRVPPLISILPAVANNPFTR